MLIKKTSVTEYFILGLIALSFFVVISPIANADTIVANIPVQYPVGITFNSNNHDLYVASQAENAIVIDGATNTVIDTIPIPTAGEPYGAGFNLANGNIYITGDNSNIMSVINSTTNTVVASIAANTHPRHILFDPLNNKVYVSNLSGFSPGTVTVFDGVTNSFIHYISVGSGPWGIALNPANGYIYVANSNDNTISVIDGTTDTVINTLHVGNNPLGVAFDTSNNYVYVANGNDNSISVIDSATNSLVTTITGIGNVPEEIAFNPANGNIYVVSEGNNGVNVINGITNTSTLVVGNGQFRGITVDPTNNLIYVTNLLNQNVSVISGTPSIDNPPILNSITAPSNPVPVNNQITVTDNFTDDSDDTHTAIWDWGDGSTSSGIVNESNGSGSIQGIHLYTTPGVYTITLTVSNNHNLRSTQFFTYVVVYDPNGGFVTGGGWITSPQGAYALNTALIGKAVFGFTAKYQNGANVPTGNTQFTFQVADLDFKSTSYSWLVIAGAKAQYKGTGTINGIGNYGFILTATDGQANGGGGNDQIRMKITDSNGNIVYDNMMNSPDGADPTTVLGGGNIIVHKS